MLPSESFEIDPSEPSVARHNAEAREVLAAWRGDRPIRVPLLMMDGHNQHGIYADSTSLDYRTYYGDADVMLQVQLAAARQRRQLPIADYVLGELPEAWEVGADFWPVPAPGWVGCELMIRPDTVIAHRPRNLGRAACDGLEMPDPRRGNLLATIDDVQQAIQRRCAEGLTFMGRPVRSSANPVDHYGVLAMALDVRGHEFLADLLEDPDWARAFLLRMAEWCDALERAWPSAGRRGYFRNTDHGIDMLSPAQYERFIVPLIVEMNRRRGTPMPSGIHHCGRGAHLFGIIARTCPLERIDDLSFPTVDVAKIRAEVGPHVWVRVEIDAGIVHAGPPERIAATVRDLMDSGARGRGRLALSVGDLLPGTPLAHREALYAAVREYGRY